MKKGTLLFSAVSTILTCAVTAHAGVSSSGGGNAVVCRDANKKIISAELFDFYEGKALAGLTIPKSNAAINDQVKAAATKLDQAIAPIGSDPNAPSFILIMATQVQSMMVMLPNGVGLQPVGDANTVIAPKDCAIEQLADFRDAENKIYIDSEIYNALSPTDQAGLAIHEGLYALVRQMLGAQDSSRTRQEVARIFSTTPLQTMFSNVPKDAWSCETAMDTNSQATFHNWSSFYAYNDASGNLVFNFSAFNGLGMLEKTTTTFHSIGPIHLPVDGTLSDGFNEAWGDLSSPISDSGTKVYLLLPGGTSNKMYISPDESLTFGSLPADAQEFTCKKIGS